LSKISVGLALGSGGAKGFAHIGVLKALTEHNIEVDMVAGSSMGSVIGAFYATGMRPAFMERLACTLSRRHWMDLTVPKLGIIAGDKIHQMVAMLTRNLRFEQIDVPLAIVATELTQRKLVTFRSGRIADAVRASISIPGVFVPYATTEGVFVDGGVMERVPVNAVRSMGADLVIAVDVARTQKVELPETIIDVIMQSLDIMQQEMIDQHTKLADIKIEPELSDIGTSHFQKAAVAIDAGYRATLEVIGQIEEMISVRELETS
jgi:NTE family protein